MLADKGTITFTFTTVDPPDLFYELFEMCEGTRLRILLQRELEEHPWD